MAAPRPGRRPGRTTALVTGAGQGIGAAIAETLARAGHAVAAVDRCEDTVRAVAARLRRRRLVARAFVADVSRSADVARLLEQVDAELGPVSILVNNAGVGGPFHRVDQVSDEEWDWIFRTNVKSVLHFCRPLLPAMKQRGFGRVINIASIQGLVGAARSSTYVASKHAMIGYTRAIAAEWGPFGITCNAICPGYVETRMGIQEEAVSGQRRRVLARTPTRRVATPEEIAYLVLSLVDDRAGHVNGSVLVADGGILADAGVS